MPTMDFNQFNFKNKELIITAAVVVGVLIVGGGGYFYYQAQQTNLNPQDATEEQNRKTIEEIGKIMDLPQGEQPTVATVTDINALSNQPFFAKAKNGDRVLIYPTAGKAILYDPGAKRIINVSPISIGTQSAQVTGEATPSATPQ